MSEFNTALQELQQAANAEHEQDRLILAALTRFNKAVEHESGLRLALCYLGGAICHRHLGNAKNAEEAIARILEVEPPQAPVLETFHKAGKRVNPFKPNPERTWLEYLYVTACFPQVIIAGPAIELVTEHALIPYKEEAAKLLGLKEEAKEFLDLSLQQGCERLFGIADGGFKQTN